MKPIFLDTERDFTKSVIELAQLHGFLVHHDVPSQTERGWRTAIQGDPGFPDIVAIGYGRLVVAELKVGRNTTSNHQEAWLWRFGQASCVEVHVWKPADWDDIEACFKKRGR